MVGVLNNMTSVPLKAKHLHALVSQFDSQKDNTIMGGLYYLEIASDLLDFWTNATPSQFKFGMELTHELSEANLM